MECKACREGYHIDCGNPKPLQSKNLDDFTCGRCLGKSEATTSKDDSLRGSFDRPSPTDVMAVDPNPSFPRSFVQPAESAPVSSSQLHADSSSPIAKSAQDTNHTDITPLAGNDETPQSLRRPKPVTRFSEIARSSPFHAPPRHKSTARAVATPPTRPGTGQVTARHGTEQKELHSTPIRPITVRHLARRTRGISLRRPTKGNLGGAAQPPTDPDDSQRHAVVIEAAGLKKCDACSKHIEASIQRCVLCTVKRDNLLWDGRGWGDPRARPETITIPDDEDTGPIVVTISDDEEEDMSERSEIATENDRMRPHASTSPVQQDVISTSLKRHIPENSMFVSRKRFQPEQISTPEAHDISHSAEVLGTVDKETSLQESADGARAMDPRRRSSSASASIQDAAQNTAAQRVLSNNDNAQKNQTNLNNMASGGRMNVTPEDKASKCLTKAGSNPTANMDDPTDRGEAPIETGRRTSEEKGDDKYESASTQSQPSTRGRQPLHPDFALPRPSTETDEDVESASRLSSHSRPRSTTEPSTMGISPLTNSTESQACHPAPPSKIHEHTSQAPTKSVQATWTEEDEAQKYHRLRELGILFDLPEPEADATNDYDALRKPPRRIAQHEKKQQQPEKSQWFSDVHPYLGARKDKGFAPARSMRVR
ncbi:hypothetical protein CLAIMM_10529 [Cladophialophora immunda]|nr:hypothetical protein CLAIMM_10529 [Cladophialophora immunda]